MNLQVSKWGNSLAIRLPSEVVRRFGLREGDSVDAQLTVDGALTIRPAGWSRRAFAAELGVARAALPVGSSVMDELRQSAGQVLNRGVWGHQRPRCLDRE